jgi:hypothetical protein
MAHLLLVYDRDRGRLLREERFASSAEALQARFDAEAEFEGRTEVEIVALGGESEEALRATHGRYFLNLDELAARMR